MNTRIAKELLEKYQAGIATPDEIALIEKWVMLGTVKALDLSDEELADDFSMIRSQLPLKYKTKGVKLWPRYAGIAAAVTAIAFGIWFFSAPRHLDDRRDLLNYTNDIPPGGNNATLTVGNGKPMQLSQAQNTVVVDNEIKYNDGTLIDGRHPEFISGSSTDKAIPNLTAHTPKGGMYSIVLPDGTRTWLNNVSDLEFPAKFGKNEPRVVKLKGEAYFEVAKDATRPFIVETPGQRTQVLGTHFNISAYPGEAIKTTLLEGSVRVASLLSPPRGEMSAGQRGEVTLKPNQQSTLTTNNTIEVKQVDASQAIAWKNGRFAYKNTNVDAVMQQIARWYNVDIAYQSPELKERLLSGTVSRYEHISGILKAISLTGVVNFKIENKTVTVIKP
jgi:hypothetical protein